MAEVFLRLTSTPRDAWEGVIHDWSRDRAADAWKRALPTVIVVPNSSHAHALKAALLACEQSCLGLYSLTPRGLRDLLYPSLSANRAQLRLLLGIAAENISPHESTIASVTAVARAPGPLLQTLESVAAAGWNVRELRLSSFEPIAQRFQDQLRALGLELTAQTDRAAALAPDQCAKISRLLVYGFDGAHWPLWFLLQAAVRSAEEATVVLTDRREEASDLDEAWIGTWEENCGAAQPSGPMAPANETLFPELFEPEILPGNQRTPPVEKHFLVGRTVSEQAKAVVRLIEYFLACESERIGVLFPAAGALPRIVARLLAEAKISHFDGIAHLTPGPLEDDAWSSWLELQESPRLRILLRFLRATPAANRLFAGLPSDRIEDLLQRAASNLLLDDFHLLRAYYEGQAGSDEAGKIVAGLGTIHLLPERSTLSDFLAQTFAIFDQLGWENRRSHLQQITAAWADRVAGTFSRAIYLRWLAEASTSVLPERDPEGDHPYSRVQLLFYPQAEGQSWSHLIFTGLNEGNWPARPHESGFIDERDIAVFNASVRDLNLRVRRQGRQGEGHSIVAEGKALFLGPAQQRELAERQFRNLCESVTSAIGASANLIEETAPERFANPSEFFTRLYLEAHGEAPGQATMNALETRTAGWLSGGKETAPASSGGADIQQTAIAYHARQKPEVPFGEYEFALREPSADPLTLSATDCERIIKAPALVWLKKFLGVEARNEELANWNLAIGQWVHDWLRQVAPSDGEFVPRPAANDVRARVQKAARKFCAEMRALLGRPLPDWWISAWNQAAFIADTLAETLTTTEAWSHFATEWTLPPLRIRVSEAEQLAVRGRVDLLLARESIDAKTFPFREVWIIDYKTGRRSSLAPGARSHDPEQDFRTKLLEGKGVQLAVYALALRALGAEGIGVSLLTRELDLERPQVELPMIAAQREIWTELARLSRSGVFGMRGELRGEFLFQRDYPLATLGFDSDFLEEKWIATHPGLPKIERR